MPNVIHIGESSVHPDPNEASSEKGRADTDASLHNARAEKRKLKKKVDVTKDPLASPSVRPEKFEQGEGSGLGPNYALEELENHNFCALL